MNDKGRVHRLYQWLSRRASFLFPDSYSASVHRTFRTEVTLEQKALTLLLGSAPADMDHCPLCGQKLAPEHSRQACHRLQADSTHYAPFPVDRDPP